MQVLGDERSGAVVKEYRIFILYSFVKIRINRINRRDVTLIYSDLS